MLQDQPLNLKPSVRFKSQMSTIHPQKTPYITSRADLPDPLEEILKTGLVKVNPIQNNTELTKFEKHLLNL